MANRREKFRQLGTDVREAAKEAGEDIVKTVASWVVASWTFAVQFAKAIRDVLSGTPSLAEYTTWYESAMVWFTPLEGKLFFIVSVGGTAIGYLVRFWKGFRNNRAERSEAKTT